MADIVPPPIHPSRAPAPDWGRVFWSRVELGDSCWLWNMTLRKGYGQFTPSYKSWGAAGAHRVAYLWVHGSIPDRMVLDHLCRVRHCVNPEHLEPVTNRENVMRGASIVARYAERTHCAEGHELPPYAPGFSRVCYPCQNRYSRNKRFEQPSESPNSAPCSGCGRIRHVRTNGLIHRHRLPTEVLCEGSGRPPLQGEVA